MKDDAAPLTPDVLLHAYRIGLFPMAETRDDLSIFWVDPKRRGILPVGGFHISRSLARRMRRGGFHVTFDTGFDAVMTACADRPETWINATILRLYGQLHRMGHGHSVEVWDDDGTLIGGSYGLAIGGAFFGESMFSRAPDGSKLALAWLLDRLHLCGFTLFDTQFLTPHLASLGGQEIPRAQYHDRLQKALVHPAAFDGSGPMATAQDVIQRSTQTS